MKKIIAVAIAALPMAAMADVTIYGKVAGGIESDRGFDGVSNTRVSDYTSRIGFKGNEDLGNGLKAIWQLESRFKVDGEQAGTGFATRQSFVGFQSNDLGTLRLGHLNYYGNDRMSDVDPLLATANAFVTPTGTRLKNAVRYDSPVFYGFNAAVMFGAGENKAAETGVDAVKTWEGSQDTWNIGLGYEYAGFVADYEYTGWLNQGEVAGEAKDGQNHRVQFGYNANNLQVIAGYQAGKYIGDGLANSYYGELISAVGGTEYKTSEATLTAAYTIGNWTPRLIYTKGWNIKANGVKQNDTGYQQYIAAVDYTLSKRTMLELSFAQTNADNQDNDARTISLGMEHKF
ncbi:porin [Laribacter hongkongensis]|uniref:Porin n=1 Tax=Laribacter hongkongensis TaxID=168471 RepID=A0A248LH10_9NEIS|nr:porin [Laribacter hongkongensis]ASJ23483.1 porin Gram-negative type [Laribacter hongkongensis]MCG9024607.1 porin [Laribacter hongkongensis]MCG9041797.1 porin [Laribacter hongkongensis]MCG9064162.1 porin [Laribacter hongkongensis]MCG9067596.1 porin [Laribacter hongkongensis]